MFTDNTTLLSHVDSWSDHLYLSPLISPTTRSTGLPQFLFRFHCSQGDIANWQTDASSVKKKITHPFHIIHITLIVLCPQDKPRLTSIKIREPFISQHSSHLIYFLLHSQIYPCLIVTTSFLRALGSRRERTRTGKE